MTDKEPIKWDDETKWAYEKCKQVEEPKEQIIIDGGDILKEQQENKKINRNCKYYHPNNKCGLKAWCMLNARKCNVNADYCQLKLRKQLARKTQECEELKEKNKVLQKLVSELEYSVQTGIELNARCCNALEGIEEIVNKKTETSICSECAYNHLPECKNNCMQDALENILDIINKAKDGKNE